MKRIIACSTLFALLILASGKAEATDWFVDGLNGVNGPRNNCAAQPNPNGTRTAPFHDLWCAVSHVHPGDVIHLLPTITYGPNIYFTNMFGTPAAPITITGDGVAPNYTKIVGGNTYGLMLQGAPNGKGPVSYVNITNFEFVGAFPNLGYAEKGSFVGLYLTGVNHINVSGNYIHDWGGNGIGTSNSDYLSITNNIVASNAKNTSGYWGSGISTWENTDIDTNTGVKIYIANNIIYGNTNIPKPAICSTTCPSTDTDGNGIILDDSRHSQGMYPGGPYNGTTLIENNIVFGNGGRGINVYQSDNAIIRNNTVYNNNLDPYEITWHPGEVMVGFSGNIGVYNNVLYSGINQTSKTGFHTTFSVLNANGGPVNFAHNVTYNSANNKSYQVYYQNNSVNPIFSDVRWGDPMFVSASLNPNSANFNVQATNPAIVFNSPAGTYAATDIDGVIRIVPITAGAYQVINSPRRSNAPPWARGKRLPVG